MLLLLLQIRFSRVHSALPQRRQPTRLPCPWDSPGKNTGVGCHFLLQCRKVKRESEVTQSCPTLRDSMDCSLPGSCVHGIFPGKSTESKSKHKNNKCLCFDCCVLLSESFPSLGVTVLLTSLGCPPKLC